ncbi:CMRF35-like molecule 9 isoform X2 [Trematomus bernacchii]|uniref:CMRF35-like molecule 9 isoform X2 n=1 Tax=Trematomus bernacchii TaxID=40690 RepID=UPI001469C8DF|nr:CMRF35-like molecule 9 isoform X2 [Trematomus bernacchii]
MNVRHTLICFLFLTLRDGNSGLTNAQNLDRTETEGGNITVACSFSFSGGRKMFCKGKCEEGNILVETTGDSAQRGRYSIRYVEGSLLSNAILYVSITKLTKSDAGRYQCGLDRFGTDSYQDFEIRVKDALRDGNSGLTNAQNPLRTETEGGNITVACSFSFSGKRKLFCKGKCEEGNILVETTGDSEQRGRYCIRYVGSVLSVYLYVSITKLTKSDAGRYQCGMEDRPFLPDSYQDIEIRVKDAPTSSKPEVTPRPFSTSSPSASTLTTTQSLSSIPSSASPERTTQSLSSVPSSASPERTTQSLSSVPSSASPERTTQPQQGQTASDGVVLYVRLTLVVMFIVLSASVLIFCWKRARKPRETADEAEYVNVTEANRECEEVREEDRGSRSPPIEMSVLSTSHCRHFSEDN